jgi:hypothetical protein
MRVNTKPLSAASLRSRLGGALLLPLLLLGLSGCGSDSGAETKPNLPPGSGGSSGLVYNGPAPATEDVQRFKLHVWDRLAQPNRCGSCHNNSQVPNFVRVDNINEAYSISLPLVDLSRPALSRLATKVAEGHNCWLASAEACGDIITSYIEAWANEVGGVVTTINFVAPVDKDVGSSRNFPTDPTAFGQHIYPLLTEYCASCHSEIAPTRQQPYFASPNLNTAYEAARPRIRLDAPPASRLVQRLATDFHNCWSNCNDNAAEMLAAINAFVGTIPETSIDPDLVPSKALGLGDGIVASSGGRVESSVIAKYEFKTRSGSVAYDTSGIEPAADLNLIGDVSWMSSWGIRFNSNNARAQASTASSRKFYNEITQTGEYAIEAWVVPDNVVQEGPARIVSYSGSVNERNFGLTQTMYNYNFFNRSSMSDANGTPELSTADAAERLQATLQHVVVTFDPVNGRRIYVNGEYTEDADPDTGAIISQWDNSYALVLGNEVSGNRPWRGAVRFLAIHKRALSAQDIATNFDVGVGEKYFLLFNVSHLIDVPQSYVVFEVQQFDDFGYLFNQPFFITLEEGASLPEIPLQGIRIGINGAELGVGQAFAKLDTRLSNSAFVDGRQPLSNLGTVIEMKQGPENDQFFLTFERIGSHTHVRVDAVPPTPAPPADISDQARIGLRTFAEINASLSVLTSVPRTQAGVASSYQKVQQQLPTVSAVEGFLAAHQMGVTQLAVAYCNALVNDTSRRASYFPGFNFSAPASSAFSGGGRSQIIEPLLQKLLAHEIPFGGQTGALANQANPDEIRQELNQLITRMTACGSNCANDRTATVVKASCAAALGGALMLIH